MLWHGLFPPLQALLNVLDQCPKIEVDVPLVKSYLAQFAGRAIIVELVSLAELAHPLENGTHFPLFLLCLQQVAKLKDREWLTDLFQQSKVNMQKMLPGRTSSGTLAGGGCRNKQMKANSGIFTPGSDLNLIKSGDPFSFHPTFVALF